MANFDPCAIFKFLEKDGYEFWIKFDPSAFVYEIFLSEDGTDYIGCADTQKDCRVVIREYLADQECF